MDEQNCKINVDVNVDSCDLNIQNIDTNNVDVEVENCELNILNVDVEVESCELNIQNDVEVGSCELNIQNIDTNNVDVEDKNCELNIQNVNVDVEAENCELNIQNVDVEVESCELNIQNLDINKTPYPKIVSECVNQPLTDDDDDYKYYPMNNKKRGIALILNHEIFNDPKHETRKSTNKDCSELENVFKNFGFEVKVYNDSTRKQIEDYIDAISGYNHSDYDCFVMTVLTHGDEGILYAKDGSYKLNCLTTPFNSKNCPTLAGKPKIYFVQACQGKKVDDGITVKVKSVLDADSADLPIQKSEATTDAVTFAVPPDERILDLPIYVEISDHTPIYEDFIMVLATLPGFYAWRDMNFGSWFIQALVNNLRQYGYEFDLLTILTVVSREVSMSESVWPKNKARHKKKQIPCIMSKLTKLIFFNNPEN